jgi:predicted transcriptional regulator
MAAVFGAATRATLTSMIFVFELTGDYRAILPLMLATVIAELVASTVLEHSLMTEKLARRGLRVHNEYEVDVLRAHSVGELMSDATPPDGAPTIRVDEAAVEAVRVMLDQSVDVLGVVGPDGEPCGTVTLADVARARTKRFAHEQIERGWRPRRRAN